MEKDPFKEYLIESEPNKRNKGYAWHTAIGLQAVDGLTTSQYLLETAIKNIEGDISLDDAQELLNSYYIANPTTDSSDRTEEADKVSLRIARILSENAFSFTPNEYISIHKKLFNGISGKLICLFLFSEFQIRIYTCNFVPCVSPHCTVWRQAVSFLECCNRRFCYRSEVTGWIYRRDVTVGLAYKGEIFLESTHIFACNAFLKYISGIESHSIRTYRY